MLGFGFQAWLMGLKPMGFGFRPPPVKPLRPFSLDFPISEASFHEPPWGEGWGRPAFVAPLMLSRTNDLVVKARTNWLTT